MLATSWAYGRHDAVVVDVTDDEQPRRYAAGEINLTVTTAVGDREYPITPAIIDAVGRRETNADIDTYIDRHGIAGLATALPYGIARECGEVTHRLMVEDLDISPLAAELILQALRPVVHEHYDVEEAGVELDELDVDDSWSEQHMATRQPFHRGSVAVLHSLPIWG